MEWLCTVPSERQPSTRAELASQLNISPRTLTNWANDPQFQAAWRERAEEVIGDPTRAAAVLDMLYKAAINPKRPNVQAAKLYLEATNAIRPQKVEVTVKRSTELTDAELEELIAANAREEQSRRTSADA